MRKERGLVAVPPGSALRFSFLRQDVGTESSGSMWSSISIIVAQLLVWFRKTGGCGEWGVDGVWVAIVWIRGRGGSYETKSEARQRVVFCVMRSHVT